MIILEPISTVQTISVMPRERNYFSMEELESRVAQSQGILESKTCVAESVSCFNNTTIELRRDGDDLSETITEVKSVINQNYIEFSFVSNILEEEYTYLITIKEEGRLIYRDKIYVTSQLDFEKKHTVTSGRYESYDTDDNRYII